MAALLALVRVGRDVRVDHQDEVARFRSRLGPRARPRKREAREREQAQDERRAVGEALPGGLRAERAGRLAQERCEGDADEPSAPLVEMQ